MLSELSMMVGSRGSGQRLQLSRGALIVERRRLQLL
jgi:hypothetical protein